jgi:hypothetical protein
MSSAIYVLALVWAVVASGAANAELLAAGMDKVKDQLR